MPAVGCHGPKKDLWVSLGRCCHCFSLRALQAAPGNIFNSTSNFNLKFEKEGGNDKVSMSRNLASRACKCTQSGLLWAGGTFFHYFVFCESDSTEWKGPSGTLKELKGDVTSPEETSREPSKQRQVDNYPVLFSGKFSDRKAVCETMYLKGAIFGKKDVCECTAKSLEGDTPKIHSCKIISYENFFFMSFSVVWLFFFKDPIILLNPKMLFK